MLCIKYRKDAGTVQSRMRLDLHHCKAAVQLCVGGYVAGLHSRAASGGDVQQHWHVARRCRDDSIEQSMHGSPLLAVGATTFTKGTAM